MRTGECSKMGKLRAIRRSLQSRDTGLMQQNPIKGCVMGLIETFRSVAFAGALLVAATSVADETQSLQKEASILEMGVVKAVAPPTEIENEVANQNAANQAITPKSLESRSVLTKESDNEPQSVPPLCLGVPKIFASHSQFRHRRNRLNQLLLLRQRSDSPRR